jgi:hypothetical protein
MSGLALTCGCYDDVYAEFDWDSCLDTSTQAREGVNLSVDAERVDISAPIESP